MGKLIDLTGQRFGRLMVIEAGGRDKRGNAVWRCRCDCGKEMLAISGNLRNGHTRSCGCLVSDAVKERNKTHGDSRKKLYVIWTNMIQRCCNPRNTEYQDYGGRGIKVCEDWLKYIPFRGWALSAGYQEGLSIERIDVNGNYTPENCTWIEWSEQAKNKRRTITLKYKDRVCTVAELSAMTGFSKATIIRRYKQGQSAEEIISASKTTK